MSSRFRFASILSAFALATTGAPAAMVVLNDGEFSPLNLTATKEADSEGTATFTAGQQLGGGNPGNHWQVTHNYGPRVTQSSASLTVSHISSVLAFDPSPGNFIASVSITFDVDVIDDGASDAVGFGPALRQGGVLYFGPSAVQSQAASWTPRSFMNLGATHFNSSMGNPDFSADGSPITFGFWTSNGTAGGATSTTTDYDNFSASITVVPEPSTLALIGIAPAVLAWRRWTQRRNRCPQPG